MKVSSKVSIDSLLDGCRRRDRRSQELLYKLTASKMLGVCMRYSNDRCEAEDVLQNGYVRVFNKIESYKGEGSFEGWIRRIMVNTAIEEYRKNQRQITAVDIDEAYDLKQGTFDLNTLEAKDLMALIQELGGSYRIIFNMYAIEGYSHSEIAGVLGISEGASKTQLSRARTLLKNKLLKLEGGKYATYAG